MVWHLTVKNPSPNGKPEVISRDILAENLTQAIKNAAVWINDDFNGFTLTRIP